MISWWVRQWTVGSLCIVGAINGSRVSLTCITIVPSGLIVALSRLVVVLLILISFFAVVILFLIIFLGRFLDWRLRSRS